MTPSNSFDICIVGAGVSGAALCSYLGKITNYRIAIIEQDWNQPDQIIGELLQPSGVAKLRDMNLGDVFSSIDAQPINGYAMFLKQESFNLKYPELNNEPINGYGFRYGKFVQGLRNSFNDNDNITTIHGKATEFHYSEEGDIKGIIYHNSKDEEGSKQINAAITIVCQGSTSRLRSNLSLTKPKINGFMLGLILENCDLPYKNHGHVIMANPGPILTYPVGNNRVRVLIDFPKNFKSKRNSELRIFLKDVIAPQMPDILKESFNKSVDQGDLKTKPTVTLSAKPTINTGAILLGDTLNMRHPVTGAGMTVALSDVKVLSELLSSLNTIDNTKELKSKLKHFYRIRKKENASLNILAFALYKVFLHAALRKACFKYLKRGNKFSLEPMSILSGISRNYAVLLKHFFSVAWLAVKDSFKPGSIQNAFVVTRDTIKIITPLIFSEIPFRLFGKAYK